MALFLQVRTGLLARLGQAFETEDGPAAAADEVRMKGIVDAGLLEKTLSERTRERAGDALVDEKVQKTVDRGQINGTGRRPVEIGGGKDLVPPEDLFQEGQSG